MHSLPLNSFWRQHYPGFSTDTVFMSCVAEAVREPMKWQNTSNSFCPASSSSKQTGCLSDFLLCASLRMRALHLHLWAMGRAGDEEWCGCQLFSADRFLFVSHSTSTENCTRFTLSHAKVSIYLKERCQWCDGWVEDLILTLAHAQSERTVTVLFTAYMFPFYCEFLSINDILRPVGNVQGLWQKQWWNVLSKTIFRLVD